MAGAWLDSVNVNNKRGTLISAKGEGAAHKASTIKVAQWKKLAAVERKYNKCTHTQAVVRVPICVCAGFYICICVANLVLPASYSQTSMTNTSKSVF